MPEVSDHRNLSVAEVARIRSEPELRQLIVQALRANGITVEEQVICAAGAADIGALDAHRHKQSRAAVIIGSPSSTDPVLAAGRARGQRWQGCYRGDNRSESA